MEADAGSNSVGWAEVTSAEYATVIRSTLRVETEGDDDIYTWACPRCKHEATNRFRHEGLITEDVAEAAERHTVTLTCGCGGEHADQPDDNTWPGCGCYAMALVEVPHE